MRLPIILDTDPGIDDAAAIAAALFAPELDLQLMTTVAGNVSVEKTTRNALQLLHFWHADVPLAQGASMPLARPLRDAASVHGESGMEGYDFVEHQRQPLAKPAFQAIRDALMHAAEPITLVAIGPLTNIALLLTQYPECVFNIRRLVIMGGSAGRGNFTPNAEFNIAIDPEAAAKVFNSARLVTSSPHITISSPLWKTFAAASGSMAILNSAFGVKLPRPAEPPMITSRRMLNRHSGYWVSSSAILVNGPIATRVIGSAACINASRIAWKAGFASGCR